MAALRIRSVYCSRVVGLGAVEQWYMQPACVRAFQHDCLAASLLLHICKQAQSQSSGLDTCLKGWWLNGY